MRETDNIRSVVSTLPDKPGVYQFIDATGTILYVGKARSLRKRVASYFTGNQSGKTRVMLSRATDLRHIVVDNESEALLLENSLIKKHQPRYNIMLKDDKTYPWICVKNEHFPRVFLTRKLIPDGSSYYGPYTSVPAVKTLLELIRHLFQIRTCSLPLTEKSIADGRYRVCLEYHMGNCKAPCVGLIEETEYNLQIERIKEIIKGDLSGVTAYLESMMKQFAAELRYEEAQKIKEKLDQLAKYRSKSVVVNSSVRNVDVFGCSVDGDSMYVSYMKVVSGAIVQSWSVELKMRMEEDRESLLSTAVTEIRHRVSSDSPEIIVPFMPDILIDNVKYLVPKRGDRHKLLELATRNALFFRLEREKKAAEQSRETRTEKNLAKMKNDLHMPVLPVHIECFDNSNIQGESAVAACVVFRNGRPSNREYRHYNIKTVTGPDDFASMEEVIYRRYRRLLDEEKSLPQLVVIDGGKGQLSSAMKSLEALGLRGKITVIGIAKRLEEIYFPGDSVPIYLDKNSITLKIIQQLRNEAHRFGINFHREKRSSVMNRSILDEIPGIGEKTKELLLKEFGSVKKISEASLPELERVAGRKKAAILVQKFKK
ncbi:MAG: excinuclease ABC subunit UvrC [Bacteroidales bacterium]|nr:excinuclease ABC subunit UvrC [Bacteroidales bacterium]NLD63390.1 excinuclease ABC subunit UvrC [Bacteroidales bacterium]